MAAAGGSGANKGGETMDRFLETLTTKQRVGFVQTADNNMHAYIIPRNELVRVGEGGRGAWQWSWGRAAAKYCSLIDSLGAI